MRPEYIELVTKRRKESFLPAGNVEVQVKYSPPYFKSSAGANIHRVRYGCTFIHKGVISHTAIEGWCGSLGFIEPAAKRHKGDLLCALHPDSILCTRCEQAATNHGGGGFFSVKMLE